MKARDGFPGFRAFIGAWIAVAAAAGVGALRRFVGGSWVHWATVADWNQTTEKWSSRCCCCRQDVAQWAVELRSEAQVQIVTPVGAGTAMRVADRPGYLRNAMRLD